MLDSRRRGRRKGVAIRPGAVLMARKEAGLTLAQVAGGVVSRAAIHLVETGRSRPSFETLQMIAERTNKPIEFFLVEEESVPRAAAGHHELLELEHLTITREFHKVVEIATGLLVRPWGRDNRAMLSFYLGQAYCRTFQPAAALDHLPAARATFEQLGDEWMAVEALDWESVAMGMVDDPRALPLAVEALDRSRRLQPTSFPTQGRILSHIAAMHVASHSWAQAMRYYEAALEAGGTVKDIPQLARMHHGLGTVYQRMNQPARARRHFERALALYSIESDLSAVYRVENDVGELLLRQGNLDAAQAHLRKALVGSDELGVDRKGRAYILTNLAETHVKKGELDDASRLLAQAMEFGEEADDRLVVANARLVGGELSERQGDAGGADDSFLAAIGTLEELAMPDRLREAHMLYAEVLERRGDFVSAARHWRAAAEIGRLGIAGVAPAEPAVNQAADA